MANVFSKTKDVGQHPKRNNFDLSFQSHSTFKFGYLYPVFCKPVVPGDSFRIDTAFDLKMMPVAFPVQSRIRAHMHYFYVRNKNLWDNFEDWMAGTKTQSQHPHPNVRPSDDKVATGSIYDFLGVPTTVCGRDSVKIPVPLYSPSHPIAFSKSTINATSPFRTSVSGTYATSTPCPCVVLTSPVYKDSVRFGNVILDEASSSTLATLYNSTSQSGRVATFRFNGLMPDLPSSTAWHGELSGAATLAFSSSDRIAMISFSADVASRLDSIFSSSEAHGVYLCISFPSVSLPVVPTGTNSSCYYTLNGNFSQYSTLGLNYYNQHQPLNALPFRAYESIYRAFYANDVLQPLVVNGDKEYNKFCQNTDDGIDGVDYHLFRRNYETDFLTSALPSPQAGPAPLVGMSALGTITVTDETGVTTAQAEVDSQGQITDVVVTSPLASVGHARTLMNIASVGMSINDFRSANALQLFLEQTLRSGYRYANFIKGHFGKEPAYRALDMPEFIGGFSRDVDVSTVVSQADTFVSGNGKSLGDFGGLGRVVGGSSHGVNCYCDDFGYIMGIMCITPTPAYSQLLTKNMVSPDNRLDYYFPEFAQIGMQQIPYREVAPLQSYIQSCFEEGLTPDDAFGYQRPNYDLVSSVDEIHGEFRATLRDYLINRLFDNRPELGTEFLEINPSEVNDIFINQNPDDDVFLGHLAFRVFAKRPIPRVHMPSLGR